ncbi:alpha/beta hydrolase fold domain-containing protein [Pseudomonas halotolerans]|uniref:alpha/beta hydrolase fold domain-containing protein n=1 Tax=Pseudomonas halotolerans TaxID=3143552 RepID=UPI0031DD292B
MEAQGLAPALIQTAEFDVLCDIGEAYARHLDTAVTITISRYNDKTHDCGMLNPPAHLPAMHTAMRQTGLELKQYLDKQMAARYGCSTSCDTA